MDLFQALKDAQNDLAALSGPGSPASQLKDLAEQEIVKFKEAILLSTKSLKEYADAQARISGPAAVHQRQLQEAEKAQAAGRQSFSQIFSGVKQFAGGGGTSGALGAASSIGQGLQSSGNPYAMAAGAGIQAAGQLFQIIGDLVKVADPGLMQEVEIAFKDIQGVIGQALVPVMRMLLPMVRTFGDFVASIIPDQEVLNSLFAAFQPILDSFAHELEMLAPILKYLITAYIEFETVLVDGFAKVFKFIVGLVADFYNYMVDKFPRIAKLVGAKKIDFEGKAKFDKTAAGSANGQAFKPELMGIADAWRKAQTATQGDSPEMVTLRAQLEALKRIENLLDRDRQSARFPGMVA